MWIEYIYHELKGVEQSFSTVGDIAPLGDSDLQGGDGNEMGNWGAFEEKWAIRGRLKKSGRLGGVLKKVQITTN